MNTKIISKINTKVISQELVPNVVRLKISVSLFIAWRLYVVVISYF